MPMHYEMLRKGIILPRTAETDMYRQVRLRYGHDHIHAWCEDLCREMSVAEQSATTEHRHIYIKLRVNVI